MFKKLMLLTLVMMPLVVNSLSAVCSGGCCGGRCNKKSAQHKRTVKRAVRA